MSFLKKLGVILANVAGIAAGIGPIVAPLLGNKGTIVGTVTNDLTTIASMISQVEVALQGKTGADKLAAAIALVGPVIAASQAVSGKKIADPAGFQKGIAEVTQGMVDVLNSLHEDGVKAEVQVH